MTNAETTCSDCERKIWCKDCKHKDVVIPAHVTKTTIQEFRRLSGLRFNPHDYVALSAG